MTTIDRQIWEWMPKRTTRARSTSQTVVAANLALSAKVERVRALHQQAPVRACPDCGGPLPAGHARCTNCKRKAGL